VTAISFWGLSAKILYETSDNNFLTFEEYRYITFLFFLIIFFSETIIFAPFAIAFLIKLFPSTFVPLIAKKILFFLTLEELKEIPEKKVLLFFLSKLGI